MSIKLQLGACLLLLAAGCNSTPSPTVGAAHAGITACTCDGTGPGNVPITANCGDTVCGSDYHNYQCTSGGWSYLGGTCGSTDGGAAADMTGGGSCSCNGTGPGNVPITVACGQNACGSDNNTYTCISDQTWSYAGQGCATPPPPDMATPADMTSSCVCHGTGPGNVPIIVACGQNACGSDNNTYDCIGNEMWSYSAQGCNAATPDMAATTGGDMAVATGGDMSLACGCDGTGPGNVPITAACGQSACGSDNNTYTCIGEQMWSYAGAGCSGPGDMAGAACVCNGTGPGNVPITVACGQNACGSDNNTYTCVSSESWSYAGAGCVAPGDMAGGSCVCNGTGPGNTPITVSCGQNACGSDNNTYTCIGNEMWSYAGQGCT